jgi:hypothetical protein
MRPSPERLSPEQKAAFARDHQQAAVGLPCAAGLPAGARQTSLSESGVAA